jgi:hypothetical protein
MMGSTELSDVESNLADLVEVRNDVDFIVSFIEFRAFVIDEAEGLLRVIE